MSNFKYFIKDIFHYDIINKFYYRELKTIPRLLKICLSIKFKKYDLNDILVALLGLELITAQKGTLFQNKKIKITLYLKNGMPIGCMLTLRKNLMVLFFKKFVYNIIPRINNFKGCMLESRKNYKNGFTLCINQIISISEFENHFFLFKRLSNLTVTFIITKPEYNFLYFFVKSFKIQN